MSCDLRIMPRRTWRCFVLAAALLLAGGCGKESPPDQKASAAPAARQKQAEPILELVFPYGSEKENWVKEVTARFNQEDHRTPGGKRISVQAMPMGSGESMEQILSGQVKAHLVSPASLAFIKIYNAQSRAKTNEDLVGAVDNLVLSPVVIAMWKPMAEAIGWPGKPIGWAEILALAKDPKGWASYGHPEWGQFKFGHTHPEYSNSGLISVLAEVYAAAGKVSGLTIEDVQDPKVAPFVGQIEKAVVHYGSSTGFFGKRMFANGPEYLSAAVLYENMVIESHTGSTQPQLPVVAVYPKEGTFWSDHPVGIVQREWVTDEHRQAAKVYIDYLRHPDQQAKALAYGFRPGVVEVPVAGPVDVEHGVNPAEPQTTLEVPPPAVMTAIVDLWRNQKKHANVVLALDTSGSMAEGNKIQNAKAGALEMVRMLADQDALTLINFSDRTNWIGKAMPMATSRDKAQKAIEGLFAGGNTTLYSTIALAHQYLSTSPQPDRITAIVVLTDGEDTAGGVTIEQLLAGIRFDAEKRPIRVFTIGYGSGGAKSFNPDVLKKIAESTQARYFEGSPQTIREVFKEIATFF